MSTINKIILLSILLVVGACKKVELPMPIEDDPVFSVSGIIGEQVVDIAAGVDDFYLFTSFEMDDFRVNSFIGRFEKLEDCTSDCEESIEFIIRDWSTSSNEFFVEESLGEGKYDYVGQLSDQDTILIGYNVLLSNHSTSNQEIDYFWDFGDNTSSTLENPPAHFYPISQGLDRAISLSVFSNSSGIGCFAFESNNIDFEQTSNTPCSLSYVADIDSLSLDLCAMMSGVPPYAFEWIIDSSYFDTCVNVSNFNDSLAIQLLGTDAQGCMESVSLFLAQDLQTGMINYCSADFSYNIRKEYESSGPIDSLNLSDIVIRYTTPDGILYSTEFDTQPRESNFTILESSEYLTIENDQNTRQLKIQFSCVLFNVDGDQMILEEGVATIAVAHP